MGNAAPRHEPMPDWQLRAEHVDKGLLRAGGIHASPTYGSLEPTLQFPALQRMAAIYGFSKTFRICLGLEWGFG